MWMVLLAIQATSPAPVVCNPHWFRPKLVWDSVGGRDSTLARLRRTARAEPRNGERWLEYGIFGTFAVSERGTDWRDRLEVQRALERAVRLLPGDPRPLAAIGVLFRKQGARVDGRRAMKRALDAARRRGDTLDPCLEAETHYQMALIHRTWWEDWEGMVSMFGSIGSFLPCVPSAGPRREGVPDEIRCFNQFYDIMSRRADLTWMRHEDRDAMIESLEAAVAANAGHRDARHALLLALYEIQDPERFGRALRAGLAVDTTDPWLPMWGAAEAYGRRDVETAQRFAEQALALLPADERTQLLSAVRIAPARMAAEWDTAADSLYWQAADPMFLTSINERLLAHVARVTYASGKYDVPLNETRGPDTEAGNLLVRYGRPWRRWQMSMDDASLGSATNGRELVWAIDSLIPPLRLARALTMRRWRLGEGSNQMVQALSVPDRWNPDEVFDSFDSLPVHAARFEDDDGGTVLDVYALWRNPHPDFPTDTLRAGFFVHDGEMRPLVDRRRSWRPETDSIPLRLRVPLAPALYWYRVETMAGPGQAAGRVLGGLRVAAPAPGSLRVSDLLLGRARADVPATITHRDSLHLDPLYDLRTDGTEPLAVYWETYGLSPDSVGAAHYRVSLDVREADRGALPGLVARLGAAIGLGRRTGVSIEWEVRVPAPTGVTRDVLSLEPALWPDGSYVLRVRIEEPATGRAVTSERRIAKASH
jgi:hypothetical protein